MERKCLKINGVLETRPLTAVGLSLFKTIIFDTEKVVERVTANILRMIDEV